MTAYTFGQFLQEEMVRRQMSQRRFAQFIGVDHTTIGRYIKPKEGHQQRPDTRFIELVALRTGAPVSALLKLVSPDASEAGELSPRAQIVGRWFDQLPSNVQDVVAGLLLGNHTTATVNPDMGGNHQRSKQVKAVISQ